MLCISAAYAVLRCLSVFVTFMNCVKTNKHIFKMFSPSGSQVILVFQYQTGCSIPTGNPLTGASNAGGVGRYRDSEPIADSMVCCERGVQYT